ncbi:MAG: hypothetical protein IKS23_01170 [Alphaproteobacteria bacterium]|nr:hypothetical protein [Alphaproteobacteria bacterium]
MKNKIILIIFLTVATFINPVFGFENIEERHTNADGSYVIMRLVARQSGHIGPDSYYFTPYDSDGNVIQRFGGHDISYVMQDTEGNVISQYNHHNTRIVFLLDENGTVTGVKNRWDGDILDTFSYTDSGKLLVYGTDGNLKGAYNSLASYFTMNLGNGMGSFGDRGRGEYIDNALNLISEDGQYYEYDNKGNIIAAYNNDGVTKYDYDQAGNLQRKIDSHGNILWRRRIYTVEEAEKVSKSVGNTFKLRYK